MTKREAAIISAYTGVLLGSFNAFHEYAEEIMNRPVFTHELADKQVMQKIMDKSRADFLAIEIDGH